MGKMSVKRAPFFQKGEMLSAEKLNALSDAINSLAAKIERNPLGPNARRVFCPPFQLDPFFDGSEWKAAITPGTILGFEGVDDDVNLFYRDIGARWIGTSSRNTAVSISSFDWPNPADCVNYQIENGFTANISDNSNGYYLCAEYDIELLGVDEPLSYTGAETPYLAVESPTDFVYLRMVPVDDWTNDDDLVNDGTGTRRIGPLGFAQIVDNVPNVFNSWHSDLQLPLIYRSKELIPPEEPPP